MKNAALVFVIVAPLAACSGSPSDPWRANATGAAVASAGVATPVATFAADVTDCTPGPAPTVGILQDGGLGFLEVEIAERPGFDGGPECSDISIPVAIVYYSANAAGPATDTVIVRESAEGRLVERDHTIEVRIR